MKQVLYDCIHEEVPGYMFSVQELYRELEAYAKQEGLEQTMRMLPYCRDMHRFQFRKGREKIPYVVHPLTMARQAIALGRGTDTILSVCLLHDVCEDCGVSPEELPVGEETRRAVALLTKPEDFAHQKEENDRYYQKIADNRIAALVKVLDRCNNVSGMAAGFPDEKIASYIRETRDYTLPLLEAAASRYPEDQELYFLLRYQIRSIIDSLQHTLIRKYN